MRSSISFGCMVLLFPLWVLTSIQISLFSGMIEANSDNLRIYHMHSGFNNFLILDARIPNIQSNKIYKSAVDDLFLQNNLNGSRNLFDQLLVLTESDRALCRVLIYNADGSLSNMCANGLRCVANLLQKEIQSQKFKIPLEVNGQIYHGQVDGNITSLRISKPLTAWNQIPLSHAMSTPVLNYKHKEFERPVVLNVGNPHAIFFLKEQDLASLDLASIGPYIEKDPLFPQRINVSFAKVLPDGTILARVWERGTGETRSCGSAASAIAWAANFMGYTGSSIKIHFSSSSIVHVNILEDGSLESSAEAVMLDAGMYDINLKTIQWKK